MYTSFKRMEDFLDLKDPVGWRKGKPEEENHRKSLGKVSKKMFLSVGGIKGKTERTTGEK